MSQAKLLLWGQIFFPFQADLQIIQRGLYQFFMSDYAHRCQISTLIMVPINFLQNMDTFSKKIICLAQKLTFLDKALKFMQNRNL